MTGHSNGYYISCLKCGKQFWTVPSLVRKYCSTKCYHRITTEWIERKCARCSKPFKIENTHWRLKDNPRYCSTICASKESTHQITKHHIDLNKNNNEESNLLYLPNGKTHAKLHFYAYKYLVETKQIQNYLDWFKERHI